MKNTTYALKEVKVGSYLIAEPFLSDTYHKRSVVLIGEHNNEGTVGFILNKPTDLTLNEALEDFPKCNFNLYFGGPVKTDTIHFVHTIDTLDGSKEIAPGVFWGGDLDTLKFMIETKQVDENDVRFFAGYSGWEPEQINSDLKSRAWFVTNSKKSFTFTEEPENLWSEVLKTMGSNFSVLANCPSDPSLN